VGEKAVLTNDTLVACRIGKNQFDRSPRAVRNWSPVTVTRPFVPTTSIDSTRPPWAASPSRRVTCSATKPPICG
jgi:hypothetical protein